MRLVLREPHEDEGESWQLFCSEAHDDLLRSARPYHFAHVVRSAPALWESHDLALGEQAFRDTAWSPWVRSRSVWAA